MPSRNNCIKCVPCSFPHTVEEEEALLLLADKYQSSQRWRNVNSSFLTESRVSEIFVPSSLHKCFCWTRPQTRKLVWPNVQSTLPKVRRETVQTLGDRKSVRRRSSICQVSSTFISSVPAFAADNCIYCDVEFMSYPGTRKVRGLSRATSSAY